MTLSDTEWSCDERSVIHDRDRPDGAVRSFADGLRKALTSTLRLPAPAAAKQESKRETFVYA